MNTLQTSEEVVRSNVSQTDDNTTENKSQGKVKKRYKSSYTLAFLLYPENASHGKCLSEIIRRYDYAYILHDKDEREQDFKEHCLDPDIPDDHILIKKTHYHVLTFHPSCKRATQMAKEMGIEPRFCQEVTDRNAMLCYLTHMGDRGKHQYSFDDVVCNRRSIYLEGLQQRLTNTEKMEKMITIIQNKNCKTVAFGMMCMGREGLTDFALKNFGLFKALIEENNYPVNPYPQVTTISGVDKDSFFEDFTDKDLPF